MKTPDYIPADYRRIKVVSSLSELFNTPFGGPDGVNSVAVSRRLSADFNVLAQAFGDAFDLRTEKMKLEYSRPALHDALYALGCHQEDAAGIILDDMKALEENGVNPRLRVISSAGYNFRVAYSFHEDIEKKTDMGRFLSCYFGSTTEWLRNEDAVPKNQFEYKKKPEALIYSFHNGDFWKHAPRNQKGILPFIHRAAPLPQKDVNTPLENINLPRLVLVAD